MTCGCTCSCTRICCKISCCTTRFTCCRKQREVLWYNWSLLLIPIIIQFTVLFDEEYNIVYMPVSLIICSFILFVNFPNLVLSFHQRPLYYDDLKIKDFNEEDEENEEHIYDNEFRKRYQNIFKWVVTITSPIVIGALCEVWYMRDAFGNSNAGADAPSSGGMGTYLDPSKTAAFAIIASLAQVYLKGSVMFGKLLMVVLKVLKTRAITQKRNTAQRATTIELRNLGVGIGEDAPMTQWLLENNSPLRRAKSDSNLIAMTPTSTPTPTQDNAIFS